MGGPKPLLEITNFAAMFLITLDDTTCNPRQGIMTLFSSHWIRVRCRCQIWKLLFSLSLSRSERDSKIHLTYSLTNLICLSHSRKEVKYHLFRTKAESASQDLLDPPWQRKQARSRHQAFHPSAWHWSQNRPQLPSGLAPLHAHEVP